VESQERPAVGAGEDLELAPADAARKVVAGERLEGSLLRRDACREVPRRIDAVVGIRPLAFREEPRERAIPPRLEEAPDAADLDEVDAEADDHLRRRRKRRARKPRRGGLVVASAASRLGQQRSAHAKTTRS
jgi:hypothetical protein